MGAKRERMPGCFSRRLQKFSSAVWYLLTIPQCPEPTARGAAPVPALRSVVAEDLEDAVAREVREVDDGPLRRASGERLAVDELEASSQLGRVDGGVPADDEALTVVELDL